MTNLGENPGTNQYTCSMAMFHLFYFTALILCHFVAPVPGLSQCMHFNCVLVKSISAHTQLKLAQWEKPEIEAILFVPSCSVIENGPWSRMSYFHLHYAKLYRDKYIQL